MRGETALGSCFGVALGCGARIIRWGLGRRAQTRELIRGYNNRTGEPIDRCCWTTNCRYCAVPSLLLIPGNNSGPGSRRAERGTGPPYSSRYIAIIAATVLSIELRLRLWIHVQRLCPCASQIPSTPRRALFGSVLKKQNTKGRLRPILSQADI